VIDLFCGIGNFSMPLARAGAQVVGLEASAEAVQMATQNAQANAVDHASVFFDEDLYGAGGVIRPVDEAVVQPSSAVDLHSRFCHFGLPPRVLILDPPRSGAGPNLEGWAWLPSLDQIVYVSCNPVTFAEDAKRLAGCGFSLSQVGVYDMFPGTAHVETVGHFVRKPV